MMKQINSNKKVITNSRTGVENYVSFSNIMVTQSTNKNFLNVSMDIFKRVDTDHIVVVEDKEETITNSVFTKIETITDTYSKDIVDSLVAATLPSKPVGISGFFDTNNFLYVNIAKSIIAGNSNDYYNLTEKDLDIN